jgi:hypothetical protein
MPTAIAVDNFCHQGLVCREVLAVKVNALARAAALDDTGYFHEITGHVISSGALGEMDQALMGRLLSPPVIPAENVRRWSSVRSVSVAAHQG